MTQQLINVGTVGNDGTGDTARLAWQKGNSNFTDLYTQLAAYGTAYVGTFVATAGQTVFTLPLSPGTVANLQISVDGAMMVPGLDYFWTTPVTVTFYVGLKVGQTVLYRYNSYVTIGTMTAGGGISGQLLYNNAGIVNGTTIGGDATLVATTGALTVTKTSGVAFAASATTDTTVAANVVNVPSGTIAATNVQSAINEIVTDLSASSGSSLVGFLQSGTGASARTSQAKLRETVSVLDFGAVGDGTTDDTAAIQAAINSCITNQKKLFIPVGTYKISSPLIIGKWSGTAWSSASLEIQGEKFTFSAQQTNLLSANIVPTFNNTFAIGIQNGRAVKISDLYILGKNDMSATIYTGANMMTNSNWVINSCRDSRYSPYAGIVIDPFGTSVPADGGYPGLSSYYVASAAGSSSLEFSGVTISGFVTGIVLCPNGITQNCSEINFNNCFIEFNKVGMAMGQSQSRNINWYGGASGPSLYNFDGNSYGAQTGYAPAISGCNMVGKYLFNVTSRYGNSSPITGVHAENFSSIGFNGTGNAGSRQPLTFVGCSFNFTDFGVGSQPDYHLLSYSDVKFVGCFFENDTFTYSSPFRFHCQYPTKIVFDSCATQASSQGELSIAPAGLGNGYSFATPVLFRDCTLQEGTSRGPSVGESVLSLDVVSQWYTYMDRNVMPVGAKIKWTQLGGSGDVSFSGGFDTDYRVALGAQSVTTGANNSATFNVADGTIVRTGDLIYTQTAFNTEGPAGTVTLSTSWMSIGMVTNVATNTVTIYGCPQNFISGTYTLFEQWWPRLHQATTGDTSTSVTIVNVTNPTSWAIGNKILGSGIPIGTYITNIVGTTITLSKATTTTVVGTRLYDANIYKLTGTAV